MVRDGQFTKCRNCGVEFGKFELPNRPLVLDVLGGRTFAHIEIKSYTPRGKRGNFVPKSKGIPVSSLD